MYSLHISKQAWYIERQMDTGISPRVRLAEGLTVRFQIQQGPLLPLHREIAFDAVFGIVATLLSHTYCQHQMQFLYGGGERPLLNLKP